MDEMDKHNLKFDSPCIYKCSCGVVAHWLPDGTQKIAEMPKNKIEYLPCGHAICGKTDGFDCIICTVYGGK